MDTLGARHSFLRGDAYPPNSESQRKKGDVLFYSNRRQITALNLREASNSAPEGVGGVVPHNILPKLGVISRYICSHVSSCGTTLLHQSYFVQ